MNRITALHSRAIVFADIENLADTGRLTTQDVAAARAALSAVVRISPEDHVVVACHPANAIAVATGWAGARYLWRGGKDGADLALIEVITTEDIPRRFGRVVVASGDGIFADAIAYLAAAGTHVTLVGRTHSTSWTSWVRAHEARTIRTSDAVVSFPQTPATSLAVPA